MEDIGFKQVEKGYRKGDIAIFKKQVPGLHAKFASDFIVRWGMVAGMRDGEDSAGRSKYRLATPDELVNRACSTVENLMSEFKARGWLLNLPEPEDKGN